jgi:putative membrane protein
MDEDLVAPGRSEAAPGRQRADYRYLLANERTFLAYLRTALALQVAGLGALQFLTSGHVGVRIGLGLAFVATGSFVALWARVKRAHNEEAIRRGDDISPSASGNVVVAVVAFVPLVAAVVISLT